MRGTAVLSTRNILAYDLKMHSEHFFQNVAWDYDVSEKKRDVP